MTKSDDTIPLIINLFFVDYLRVIGAWETHRVAPEPAKPASEVIVHKTYHNQSGDWDVAYINRTTKINVNGILIEYEGEDSGIGLLFASKAAIQVSNNVGSVGWCWVISALVLIAIRRWVGVMARKLGMHLFWWNIGVRKHI